MCKDHFDLEADVHLFPVTPPTRNMLFFGQLVNKTVPQPSPDHAWLDDIQALWSQSNPVCSVCGLRPQGPNKKALTRNVCDICEKRRKERARKWTTRLDHTIWIDEVVDKNGRIALVVGVFDLTDWLNARLLNTITAFDPKTRQLTDHKRNNKNYEFDYPNLCLEIQERLKNPDRALGEKDFIREIKYKRNEKTLFYNLILKNQRPEQKKNARFGDIYDLYVSDSDLNYPQKKENWRFALAMIRQQPSAARIRRIWETTRRFWKEIQNNFQNTAGRAGPRVEIRGGLAPKKHGDTLGHYHVYTLLLEKNKLGVVWDPGNKRFITAYNLEYLAEPTQLGKDVKDWLEARMGDKVQIEEPTGYGSRNKVWGTITIKDVSKIQDSTYTPAIPILAEPKTFMALVPADKALDVVTAIRDKYEQEMGKVRNRLPMHLGVVFAPHKTPLRAIMDAGRRMLEQKASADGWEVKKDPTTDTGSLPDALRNDPHFAKYVRLELSRGNRQAVWHVPLRMGEGTRDGITSDSWYPYVFVEHDKNGSPPTGRNRMFEAPCPWNLNHEGNMQPTWLVHTEDLEYGDTVYFTPATLDFQWLDTSGRRFEIAYDDEGRRLDIPRRPYLIDEIQTLNSIWETLADHLTSTRIHVLRDLIEAKRIEWEYSEGGEIFRRFCRDVIANTEWRKCNGRYPWKTGDKRPEEGWLERWADYSVHGWLYDAIELYVQIMKKKPKSEKG